MLVLKNERESLSEIDFKEGAVALIDKPLNWTSFDVVNKIRFLLRKKYELKKFKVGHNGTLDPLATGLVMIFMGKYTKKIALEENHDKEYKAVFKFGATTESLDRETEEIDIKPIDALDLEKLKVASQAMLGDSMQVIPIYSAAKIKGQPMYKLARLGKEVPVKHKPVTIHRMDCNSYEAPYAHCDIHCSKGTYVRALARDLGIRMGTSAYLYGLKRTKISSYSIEDAFELETFCNLLKASFEH